MKAVVVGVAGVLAGVLAGGERASAGGSACGARASKTQRAKCRWCVFLVGRHADSREGREDGWGNGQDENKEKGKRKGHECVE